MSDTRATWRPRWPAAVTTIVATAAVAAVLASAAPETTTFQVRDGAGQVLYARPIVVGGTFRLEHTHSVTRRPVVETFSVATPDTIALEELWFDTFGANLPFGPETIEGRTTTFLEVDDGYRVLHHGTPIGVVPLLVGSAEVDHVVEFDDGQRVHLLDIARRWQQVELAVGETAS